MKLPELLAPAGSKEALIAAVAAGADAVYLSGKRFGARKYATNFDEAGLKEAVNYAHLRGVKVYVTVNTLARDDELTDIAEYLIFLFEIGVDAVLVQDLGVASLARRLVPDLSLHASTQMTIHNRDGAAFVERLGFKRVVLSREVTLDESERMAKDLDIGLEVFIHGALCYCYSGQCLLSSVIGGRSGNRGMCAQPCRKPYVLLKGDRDEYGRPMNLSAEQVKERFLMSTRDLAVYEQLDKIAKSGIQSLKIEGRMKSAEYVAIVTSIYRRALDGIAKGSWLPSKEEIRDLALAFNRDFTGGYLLGSKAVMGREMSDNRGVLVGIVASYDQRKEEASVRLAGSLGIDQGDGLVIQSPGQETGMIVYRQPVLKDGLARLKTPDRVRPGAKVYLTGSSALTKRAEKIISKSPAQIPLDIKVMWEDGTPLVKARVQSPSGLKTVEVKAGFRMEQALTKPLTSSQIEAQLKRTGDTPFYIRKMEIDYPGGLFAPLSHLNQLRRELLEMTKSVFLEARRPDASSLLAAKERLKAMDLSSPTPSTISSGLKEKRALSLAVYADSLDIVQGAVDGGCRRIYFEPYVGVLKSGSKDYAECLLDQIVTAREICDEAELIWKWPRITRDKYLGFASPLIKRTGVDGVMVEGAGAAEAAHSAAPGVPISGSSSLNIWNHLAVWQLSPLFQRLTLSPELSADQLAELIVRSRLKEIPQLELIVQGNLEVVITEDCLPCLAKNSKSQFWGLQDFRRIFPLYADDDSRTHILNSVETCLIDFMPKLFQVSLDGIAIDSRSKAGRYAKEMAEIYLQAVDLTDKGGESLSRDLVALKEEVRKRSLGGITTGHFVKGLRDELPNMG